MQERLKELGLSPREAQAFVLVQREGRLTGKECSALLRCNRSLAYTVLHGLWVKGLVGKIEHKGILTYVRKGSDALAGWIRSKEQIAAELAIALELMEKSNREEVGVSTEQGHDALQIFTRSMIDIPEVLLLNATGNIAEYLPHAHGALRGIAKNRMRIIASPSFKEKLRVDRRNYPSVEVKFLPAKYTNKATTYIYGDIVVIQLLEGIPFLIKIKSKAIAAGYRSNFNMLWESLSQRSRRRSRSKAMV